MDVNQTIDKLNKIKNQNVIDIDKWKDFKITDLFEVSGTETTPKAEIVDNNGPYPYVTTKATNNAIDGYSSVKTEKGNVLVIDSAVLGYMTYQEDDFSASDHVEKLVPKFKLNKYIGIFICTVWNKAYANSKYNYQRKASQKEISKDTIRLPVNQNGEPDFEYIEAFIIDSKFGGMLQAPLH